jgi:type VI protein secretion system component Hcp
MGEIFVKIDSVTGTGTGAHQGWLKVLSAQLSSPRQNSIAVSRVQDQASPKLFRLAIDGTGIPTVTIDFVKDGRIVTRLELTNVIIDEFHPIASQPPMESMTFHYVDVKAVLGVILAGHAAMAGGVAGVASRVGQR